MEFVLLAFGILAIAAAFKTGGRRRPGQSAAPFDDYDHDSDHDHHHRHHHGLLGHHHDHDHHTAFGHHDDHGCDFDDD